MQIRSRPIHQTKQTNELIEYLKQVTETYNLLLDEPSKEHYERLIKLLNQAYKNHLNQQPNDPNIDSAINDELLYFELSMLHSTDFGIEDVSNDYKTDFIPLLLKSFKNYDGINDAIKLLRQIENK